MHVNCFLIAEWAGLTKDNKLMFAGTFDSVNVTALGPIGPIPEGKKLGIPMPMTYLVLHLEGSIADGLVHSSGLRIVDQDGRAVTKDMALQEIRFQMNRHGRGMRFVQIAGLQGLTLPGAGDYTFILLIDGEPKAEYTIYVEITEQAP